KHFTNIIKGGNQYGWWKDAQRSAISIEPKQLLRDVKTWWDSTYQMLTCLQEFCQVSVEYTSTTLVCMYIRLLVSPMRWHGVTRRLITILQFLHEVQQVMLKDKTPILAGTIPSFEQFMSCWEQLAKKNVHLAPAIKIGLDFTMKYYKQIDDTDAYVVAMCEYNFQVLKMV
ncbi:hypothetical protein L208DRAFT_1282653, partial [Tricholoma matsutake]